MDILILGEAWGEDELRARTPFVGWAGQELNRMLREASIERSACFLTNVFNLHPPGNKVGAFCGPKPKAMQGYPPLNPYGHQGGGYVREEFTSEFDRLGEEILQCNPNIIIALGNTAMWALLGRTAISKFRGTTQLSTLTAAGYKVLPTFHPSYIARGNWSDRPTVVMDLDKARRESGFPEVRRPSREIWIEPKLEDLDAFRSKITGQVAVDIETHGQQITCIGFGASESLALVVPFYDRRRKGGNYWFTTEAERKAWDFVGDILGDPKIRKVFQNGLFDIAFIWRTTGIKTYGAEHDTMLLHHALFPESLKSLGFLGSLYTDEGSWKQMREIMTTIKRDE
jgi:DNA polymerase